MIGSQKGRVSALPFFIGTSTTYCICPFRVKSSIKERETNSVNYLWKHA